MKPQVEIFDIALKSLSTTADWAIFVGDSIVWDVARANDADIYSIWINSGGVQRSDDDPLPNAEIDSLAGLDESYSAD